MRKANLRLPLRSFPPSWSAPVPTFRKDGRVTPPTLRPEHAVEVREAGMPRGRVWEIGCALAGLNRTQYKCSGNSPRELGRLANQTEATLMIQVRRLQRSFGEGLIAEAVHDLWEELDASCR